MKSSLRDLLSWVWQIILTWLTGVATGTDLPLCIERTAKMGVKATDPEMAVEHETQEAAVTRNEAPGLVVKNEQVTDAFLRSDTGEVVVVTSDTNTEENEGMEIEVVNASSVEIDNDESGAEINTDSIVLGNSDSNVAEDNSDLNNFNGGDNSSNHNKEEVEITGNEEENGSSSVVNANVASSTADVNHAGHDAASNSDEANNVDGGDTNSKKQKDDVNDSDEDYDEDDDDDDEYSETNNANEVKVTWLLKLSSRPTYQKVLCPQYYSLNFRTVVPLKEENVRTAMKQLRSLLPWLGFGLRRQKEDIWLCMYPENNIDFQTADDEDHQWFVVANCREQFSYLENGCLCTFRLMKSYPCTQCQTDFSGTSTSTTSIISNETSACSSTASTSVTRSTSTVSTTMAKDTSEITSASHCEDTGANSDSIRNVDNVTEPSSIINKTSNMVTLHNTCTDNNSAIIHEAASFSCNTEKESATNTSVNPSSAIHTVNDNIETTTFTHNYRLVFGVPQPLADETSADVICDTFIKELNNVISRTMTSVSPDVEKKNDCDTTEMNGENGDNNRNSETSSSNSDNQVNNHQPDNTAIVSDNDTNHVSVSENNDKQVNSEIIHQHTGSDNDGNNATASESNDKQVNSEIIHQHTESDNDANNATVSESSNKQVNSEIIHQHTDSDNDANNATVSESGDKQVNSEIIHQHTDSDNDANNATVSESSDKQVNSEIIHQHADSDNDANNATVSESSDKQVNSEIIHQHKVTDSNEAQEKNDEIRASIQQQLTIIENALASEENILEDKKDKSNARNNNVNAINRDSPHIERTVEMPHTRSFINKCKTKRVSFVSGFAACVNAALANTLVKYGIKEENQEFRIGHIISVYYNLEDLSDQEWHDRDDHFDDDDEDDNDDDERRRAVCCKAATVTLNIRSKDWHNQFWERVQWVDKKRWDMCLDTLGVSAQKIPLSTEQEDKDERFPSIYQPSANLSISNISGHIPRFSMQMENIESMTLQRLLPLFIFLMTNSIAVTLHKNCLRFSFYHQNHFVPHHIAHHFADEIVSVMEKSLVS